MSVLSTLSHFHSAVSRHHINNIRFIQILDCHRESESSTFHTVLRREIEEARVTEGGEEGACRCVCVLVGVGVRVVGIMQIQVSRKKIRNIFWDGKKNR